MHGSVKARKVRALLCGTALLCIGATAEPDKPGVDYAGDAAALDKLIVENYAYEERWPGGKLPDSPALAAERAAVHDADSLLHYAEDRIATLADHHALTGSSFKDSWAIVPSYADLWVVEDKGGYRIDAVRVDSPAAQAGIHAGDRLIAVDGVPVAQAVDAYWKAYGLTAEGDDRAGYAARVLAAGRRDRPRHLTIAGTGGTRNVTLDNLYGPHPDRPALSVSTGKSGVVTIRFNNAIGDSATIAAFDEAMAKLPAKTRIVIDLSDTPSGGTTSIARAVMGWFVTRPTSYQMHQWPAEERETGIPRQWIEQVLPRAGKSHPRPVAVRVGRWTGSMGEGLAVGFAAMGVPVCGDAMAGLAGGVYDFSLPSSGMVVKFPAERIYTVSGQPREHFKPRPASACPA